MTDILQHLIKNGAEEMKIKQGDVLVIQGDNTTEKVIVVQNNIGNYHSPTTIVYSSINDNIIVKTIDKKRIIKKIGQVSSQAKQEILQDIKVNLISTVKPIQLSS